MIAMLISAEPRCGALERIVYTVLFDFFVFKASMTGNSSL